MTSDAVRQQQLELTARRPRATAGGGGDERCGSTATTGTDRPGPPGGRSSEEVTSDAVRQQQLELKVTPEARSVKELMGCSNVSTIRDRHPLYTRVN